MLSGGKIQIEYAKSVRNFTPNVVQFDSKAAIALPQHSRWTSHKIGIGNRSNGGGNGTTGRSTEGPYCPSSNGIVARNRHSLHFAKE